MSIMYSSVLFWLGAYSSCVVSSLALAPLTTLQLPPIPCCTTVTNDPFCQNEQCPRKMESNEPLDKMKRYVAITQKLMAEQEIKCKMLTEEVMACQRMIECLKLDVREAHKVVNSHKVVK